MPRLSRPRPLRFESLENRRVLATLWVDPFVAPSGNIFSTISAAVSAAHSGDTIKVEAGHTYNETVAVNKSLTLTGGQVRVTGEPTGASILSPTGFLVAGFEVTASNVTIKNFTVQNAFVGIGIEQVAGINISANDITNSTLGLLVNSPLTGTGKTMIAGNQFHNNTGDIASTIAARNVVISHNTFQLILSSTTSPAAIDINGTSQSTGVQIVNNRFETSGRILLANATKCKVDGNTILNPVKPSDQHTILFGGAVTASEINGNVLVDNTALQPFESISLFQYVAGSGGNSGNTVSGNSITGFVNGIISGDGSHNTFSRNTVENCRDDGILVQEDSDTIASNTIANIANIGILVYGNNHKISSNTAIRNDGGIDLIGSGVVSGNTATGNRGIGIEIDGATAAVVSGNVASFNSGDGIFVKGGVKNQLSHNTANDNFGDSPVIAHGIQLDNSAQNTLSGNTARRNQQDGFALTGNSHDNVLTSNTARSNLGSGFSTTGGGTNTFSQDTAGGNFSRGFDIQSSGNTVSKCLVIANAAYGIDMAGNMNTAKGNKVIDNLTGIIVSGSSQTVSGNTVMGNRNAGISLITSSGSTISGNTVDGNYRYGITVDSSSSGNAISGNTAMGNGDAFGGFDLLDLSTGAGTAGTANTWAGNKALTRHPSGLL